MNSNRNDALLIGIAVAMGVGVSTGYPLGMVAAAGMPFVCLLPGTRKAGFRTAFGYYVVALWPIVPGIERYLGSSNTVLAAALWVLAATLLSAPWTIAWTSRRCQSIWRAPLALLSTIVPPLGIIGLASPLTAAGYLFPGTAWFGLATVTLLPGILLATRSFSWRLYSLTFAGILCLASHFCYAGDAKPPVGWIAVNTHFGDLSQPFRDFEAAQFIQRTADQSSARVVIFPEAVVPRWSEATEAFWQPTLDRCRAHGQTLAFGAGLPATFPRNNRNKLRDLRAYDFDDAIEALNGVPARAISLRPHLPVERVDNAMLVVGAQTGRLYQRVPVPVGMWRPFDRTSVPIRLLKPGVLAMDHQRAAVIICYEQMLTFPILASMLGRPSVIVGISNTFWVDATTIPLYQASAISAWAKLFRVPYLLAFNS